MTAWRLRVQQVIQTFSAKDQDLPSAGQQFSFKSSREDNKNKNFTIRDFGSKNEFFPVVCWKHLVAESAAFFKMHHY